jgi:hypothetical protein
MYQRFSHVRRKRITKIQAARESCENDERLVWPRLKEMVAIDDGAEEVGRGCRSEKEEVSRAGSCCRKPELRVWWSE